jgi:hypothetical protein
MFEDYYMPRFDEDYYRSGIGFLPEPSSLPAVRPSIIEAAPIMGTPRQTAVMPMTQAAAPYDFSNLDLSLLGGFGGGRMGGVIQNPNMQYIGAPVSNRGDDTGRMGGNVFTMTPNQPVRLVDRNTNTIVFEGVGYDAARKATELGQGITDARGRKANYIIQTANPDGVYTTVAHENRNKTFLGDVANVVGTALPIAVSLIPGLQFAGPVLSAALAGGAGAALKGDDILKGALIGGATAGITSGTGLDKAIGGVLSGVGKGVTQGAAQGLGNAAGDIVVTGLSKGLQAAGGALGQAALSQVGKAGLSEITGYKPPAEKFAEQPLPEALRPPTQIPVEDAIVVSGVRPTPAVDAVTGAISGIGNAAAADVINQPTATEPSKTAEEIIEEETGEIVSLGEKTPSVNIPVPGIGTPGVIDPVSGDIVVSKPKPEPVTKEPDLPVGSVLATLPITGLPTPDPALTEKSTLDKIKDAYDIARVGAALLPLIPGGGGDSSGTRSPDTTGLNFTKSPLRPTLTGSGIGGVGGNYPYTPQTYGRAGGDRETEYLFFTRDPATGQETVQAAPASAVVNPATIPVKKEGGEINDDMVKHLVEYHKDGGHHGPGRVKGIGSGQEDKIPAYLSDGEYVWSAQDVSDLGDGSNDEGVRRLDKMRQMVRRQAGRKDVKKIAKPQKGIDRMLKAVGGMV